MKSKTYETKLANYILGPSPANLLKTDGYKFAMAQAGFPMREETFYMSFRRRGAYYIPFDVETLVKTLMPADQPDSFETQFLDEAGYTLTPGMKAALRQNDIQIHAAPKGSWVREKEPIFAITCPSFLASVLEPLALMLHYPIQVATEALLNDRKDFVCTCVDEANITKLTLKEIGKLDGANITVEYDQYRQDVSRRAQSLIDALVDKDPNRLFEVGMRACSCMEMHSEALAECKELGINSTSNVYLAAKLEMKAVGTTGHEHIMRWGSDLDACRAMRDMRPGTPSCLPDTFDVIESGLPAAFQVMRETPNRSFFIRFDSGDQDEQLRLCVKETADLSNVSYIFEDSINDKKVRHFEALCDEHNIPTNCRLYGAGGFFVRPEFTDLTRDRVSAVYKLCRTSGIPVMKTCTSAPAKASLPGVPVIFRRDMTVECDPEFEGYTGLIGQAAVMDGGIDLIPRGFVPLKPGMKPDMNKDIGLTRFMTMFRAYCMITIQKRNLD